MTFVGPALVVLGYLLGSILFGVVIASRRGVDLRGSGSGNVGATNVERLLGKRDGRIVMLLDALKGILPVLGARLLLGQDDPWVAATGVAAVLGHCLPIWHRFRGGKGAATAAGVLLAAVPPAGAAAGIAFFVLKKLTKRASVGSLGGAVIGAAVTAALHGSGWPTVMAGALLAIVIVRHHDNIGRLMRGEEPPSTSAGESPAETAKEPPA